MKNWKLAYIANQKILILTIVELRLKSAHNYDEGFSISFKIKQPRYIVYGLAIAKMFCLQNDVHGGMDLTFW